MSPSCVHGCTRGCDTGCPFWKASEGPAWFPRDIIVPANEGERDAVRVVQRALRLSPTGNMDESTKASLRGVQHLFKLPVTGTLDERTAVVIDSLRPWQLNETEEGDVR